MRFRDLLFGVAAVGVLFLASCASSPKMPGAPGMRMEPVGPEPTTVDDAQADINRWSAQLGIAPTPPPTATTPNAGPPTTPTDSPPSAPPRPVTPTSSESVSSTGSGDARQENAGSECVAPCRAIASMRRSVAALCRLAGEDDPRCVSARQTLDEGERRVARCGC